MSGDGPFQLIILALEREVYFAKGLTLDTEVEAKPV